MGVVCGCKRCCEKQKRGNRKNLPMTNVPKLTELPSLPTQPKKTKQKQPKNNNASRHIYIYISFLLNLVS